MKRSLLLFISCFLLFACKKDAQPTSEQTISGVLHYSDPAIDGMGLYFETDKEEALLFKNEYADYYTQYLHFKDFVEVKSRLTFIDRGETGCSGGMIPCPQQHPFRVVEVVKLEKE